MGGDLDRADSSIGVWADRPRPGFRRRARIAYSVAAMWANPDEPIEHVLAQLCRELGPSNRAGAEPEITPRATLEALGFDSLMCADLALAVEERFGVRLADADVTSRTSVGEIARLLRSRGHGLDRLPQRLGGLQALAIRLVGPPLRLVHRLQVQGTEHVPAQGPAVMAANHRSNWDVPIHVLASPRPILFIAKDGLFAGPLATGFWNVLGGFSVRRELADLRAIDRALGVLERGDLLGIYPEGRRNRTGSDMLPFLHGAAWLALRSGAPIVPAGIGAIHRREGDGAARRVRVAFGPPLHVEREDDPLLRRKKATALTGELRSAVGSLLS